MRDVLGRATDCRSTASGSSRDGIRYSESFSGRCRTNAGKLRTGKSLEPFPRLTLRASRFERKVRPCAAGRTTILPAMGVDKRSVHVAAQKRAFSRAGRMTRHSLENIGKTARRRRRVRPGLRPGTASFPSPEADMPPAPACSKDVDNCRTTVRDRLYGMPRRFQPPCKPMRRVFHTWGTLPGVKPARKPCWR